MEVYELIHVMVRTDDNLIQSADELDQAIVLWPLQDMPSGTREFGIKDYYEYHIAFAQKTSSASRSFVLAHWDTATAVPLM